MLTILELIDKETSAHVELAKGEMMDSYFVLNRNNFDDDYHLKGFKHFNDAIVEFKKSLDAYFHRIHNL